MTEKIVYRVTAGRDEYEKPIVEDYSLQPTAESRFEILAKSETVEGPVTLEKVTMELLRIAKEKEGE